MELENDSYYRLLDLWSMVSVAIASLLESAAGLLKYLVVNYSRYCRGRNAIEGSTTTRLGMSLSSSLDSWVAVIPLHQKQQLYTTWL